MLAKYRQKVRQRESFLNRLQHLPLSLSVEMKSMGDPGISFDVHCVWRSQVYNRRMSHRRKSSFDWMAGCVIQSFGTILLRTSPLKLNDLRI